MMIIRNMLILSLSFLTILAYGDTRNGELLCDGLSWLYYANVLTEKYVIDGSRMINGKNYYLLRVTRSNYDRSRAQSMGIYSDYTDSIGVRDEGGRIYVNKEEYLSLMTEGHYGMFIGQSEPLPYESTADGELILYDFTKNVGDVYCEMADGGELTVTKVDTLKTEDGMSRRRLTLSNGFDLIEGIGCANSKGFFLFWLNTKPSYLEYMADIVLLIRFMDNEKYIFVRDYETTIKEMNGYSNKMLTHGRRWEYDYDNGEMKGTLTYSIEGDTILLGYKRAKLKMVLKDKQTGKVVRSGYAGAFNENRGCLCYLTPDGSEEYRLYRFDWPCGTHQYYDIYDRIWRFVVNVDDVTVGEESFHRLQLINKRTGEAIQNKDKDSLYYWIEGIGSSKGLLDYRAGTLMDSIQFVACYDGEKCIFTKEDMWRESEQPYKFKAYMYVDALEYFLDLANKTAYLIRSYDSHPSGHIIIPPSVDLWGVDCVVDRIDIEAFYDEKGLISVDIPETVTCIGDEAFTGCSGLTSITIPGSVTTIGEKAFMDCSGLTSIKIPESVSEISNQIFSRCTGLKSVSLPSTLVSVGVGSFFGCEGLTSVSLPEGVTTIGINAFGNCYGLTEIEFPSSLTSIGKNAFWNCYSLREIDIPSSVTNIGETAFRQCTSLERVYCRAKLPPHTDGPYVFVKSNTESTLYVPAASVKLYKKTAPWSDFKYVLPIEEGINIINVPNAIPQKQKLFDLQGRPVKEAAKHGIYVKDGRKVVM